VHALDRFVGQSLKVKILEVDRARKRVVVSQREAIEAERRRRREKTLASLQENKVYRGTVRRITDYGAFVDLGGVDGLLHITEMSWTRINHPSDVLKVGEKIDVMILRFDRERTRISLGLKQILPDPWEQARERFKLGQVVPVTVSRVVPAGAFVRLETGIEGIVPNAELPGGRGQRARDILSVGDTIQVKITAMRPNERRMTLSLRQVQQARERRQAKEYMDRQQESSRVTIGDLFGTVLSETQAARGEAEADSEGEAAPAEQAKEDSGEEAAEEKTAQQTDSPEEEECSSSESPAESEAAKD
jgi:4-hydroxy-3-methylbut-2-enyl diphosphate reductase